MSLFFSASSDLFSINWADDYLTLDVMNISGRLRTNNHLPTADRMCHSDRWRFDKGCLPKSQLVVWLNLSSPLRELSSTPREERNPNLWRNNTCPLQRISLGSRSLLASLDPETTTVMIFRIEGHQRKTARPRQHSTEIEPRAVNEIK